jgi:hypothetical protein
VAATSGSDRHVQCVCATTHSWSRKGGQWLNAAVLLWTRCSICLLLDFVVSDSLLAPVLLAPATPTCSCRRQLRLLRRLSHLPLLLQLPVPLALDMHEHYCIAPTMTVVWNPPARPPALFCLQLPAAIPALERSAGSPGDPANSTEGLSAVLQCSNWAPGQLQRAAADTICASDRWLNSLRGG